MPFFICPNCKNRSIDDDGRQGLLRQAVSCERCGFGFLFEIRDDYYPAPTAGLVACDRAGRILAAGRGVFELTGYRERELMGKDVVDAFGLEASRRARTRSPSRSSGVCGASVSSSSCARARAR